MNNEILDSLRRISCGMEIVMRDVIVDGVRGSVYVVV